MPDFGAQRSPKQVGRRVREIRGLQSQPAFSKKLGIMPDYLSKIERGIFPLSRKLLQAISEAFNINVSWLLYGEGPKERQGQVQPEAVPGNIPEIKWAGKALIIHIPDVLLATPEEETVSIPLMAIPVGAGIPTTVDNEIKKRIPWLLNNLPQASRKHRLAAATVRGDSMMPTLPEGSVCIVDLDQTDASLLLKKLVVARAQDEWAVKRLEVRKGKLFLTSDNPDYPDIPVDSEMSILGRVIKVLWSPD